MTDHMAVAAESTLWEYERYGVKLVNINEDFDYLALGHVEPRRFAATLNAYYREFVYDESLIADLTLKDFNDLQYLWGEFWIKEESWYFVQVAASSPYAVAFTRFG